jgi:hypothetical protein
MDARLDPLGHHGVVAEPWGDGAHLIVEASMSEAADRTVDVAYARVSSSTGIVRTPAVCRS